MASTLNISDMGSLTFSIANDGVITISYPGQTSIVCPASSYRQWYTYGILGSGTNPLVFVCKTVGAPTGLKTESYVNNASLAIGLGTNASAKYVIYGNGDLRPMNNLTAISVLVDNQSCNSGSPSYPKYLTVYTSGGGTVVTFYHP